MILIILRPVIWTEKGIVPSVRPGVGRGQEAAKMSGKEQSGRQEENQECGVLWKPGEEHFRRRSA